MKLVTYQGVTVGVAEPGDENWDAKTSQLLLLLVQNFVSTPAVTSSTVVVATATYTVKASDTVINVTTAGAVTLTLPSVVGLEGTQKIVVDSNGLQGSGYAITLTAAGVEVIGLPGLNSMTFPRAAGVITLAVVNQRWRVLGRTTRSEPLASSVFDGSDAWLQPAALASPTTGQSTTISLNTTTEQVFQFSVSLPALGRGMLCAYEASSGLVSVLSDPSNLFGLPYSAVPSGRMGVQGLTAPARVQVKFGMATTSPVAIAFTSGGVLSATTWS